MMAQKTLKTGASYFGNRILKYVEADMKLLKASGCNFVVHTFSENDLQYYAKTMEEMVQVSHEAGLEVHIDPWGVGQVFGGEAYSSFLYRDLSSWQITSKGQPAPIACLNHPGFNAFMEKWIHAAVATGADVVFWDEPHWYLGEWFDRDRDEWGCLCQHCRALFYDQYGFEMPVSLTKEVLAFREQKIVDFLGRMARAVKLMSHGKMRNAVCLLPVDDPRQGVMDWGKVCGLPEMDIFGTDPYWFSFQQSLDTFAGGYAEKVVSLCETYQKEAQIWVQSFRVPKGREGELAQGIQLIYDKGVRNIATWGVYGCHHLSFLRSEGGEEAWHITLEAFQALHQR